MQFVNFLKKQLIKVKHLFKIQLLVDNNPMGCFLYSEIFQISNFFLAHQLLIKILADFFMENGFVKSLVLVFLIEGALLSINYIYFSKRTCDIEEFNILLHV